MKVLVTIDDDYKAYGHLFIDYYNERSDELDLGFTAMSDLGEDDNHITYPIGIKIEAIEEEFENKTYFSIAIGPRAYGGDSFTHYVKHKDIGKPRGRIKDLMAWFIAHKMVDHTKEVYQALSANEIPKLVVMSARVMAFTKTPINKPTASHLRWMAIDTYLNTIEASPKMRKYIEDELRKWEYNGGQGDYFKYIEDDVILPWGSVVEEPSIDEFKDCAIGGNPNFHTC